MRARLATPILLFAAVASAPAQGWRLPPPRDDVGRDPTLATYLEKLRAAVREKNSDALMGLISPDIKNGFGGEDGDVYFRQLWQIDTGRSPVWGVLELVLSLSGAWYDDRQYCLPYVSARFPQEIDASTHSVVIGDAVRLREGPSTAARVVAGLSYDIVEVVKRDAEWTEVRTHDGKTGFVYAAYLHSPVAYRACLMKNDAGEWKMRALLAGD